MMGGDIVTPNIARIDQGHELWAELEEHLQRSGDWRWVSNEQGILPGVRFIAALCDGRVVGHISLKQQELEVPSEPPTSLSLSGRNVYENFVQTFHVDEAYRRQGLGSALQLEALEWSRELGCFQLRSWSSLDRQANYALKLKLGFAFCPGTYVVPSIGQQIPGGWFVKQLG
jgi:GNAT superfamily N-acetyltransferase